MKNLIYYPMLPFLASMFFSMAILVFLHFKGLFICPIFTDERITAKAHLLSLKNDEKLSLWRRFWTVYRVLTIFLMLSISLPFIINVICRIKIENACIPPTPSNVVGSYILSAIFMALSVWLLVLSIKLKSNKPFDNSYNSYRRESGIERWVYVIEDIFHITMRISLAFAMCTLIIYPWFGEYYTLWGFIPFIIFWYLYMKMSSMTGSYIKRRI